MNWGDPTLEVDLLPQPFNFINKVLLSILQNVDEEIENRQQARGATKAFCPPVVPCTNPVGCASVPNITCIQLCGHYAYAGKEDGSIEVFDVKKNYRKVMYTVPLLQSSIARISVQIRAADNVPLVALAGVDATAGMTVVALTGHPAAHHFGENEPEPVEVRTTQFSAMAYIMSPELIDNHPVTEIQLSPEGKYLAAVFAACGKVAVYDTRIPMYPTVAAVPMNASKTHHRTSKSTINKGPAPAEPSSRPPTSSTTGETEPEGAWVSATNRILQPCVTASCPTIPPPCLTEMKRPSSSMDDAPAAEPSSLSQSFIAHPLVHFLSSEVPEGTHAQSAYCLRQPREVHTLIVGWRGLNVFTTFGLCNHNPYLSHALALPRRASEPKEEPVAQAPKGKDKKGAAKAPPAPATAKTPDAAPEPPDPSLSANGSNLDHLLPSLMNCSSTDFTTEYYAAGCSEGTVVVWNTVLGIPKYIFNEAPNRATRRTKHPLMAYSLGFFKKSFLAVAHGIPGMEHASHIYVYNLDTGIKVSSVKYLNHLIVLKCIPTVPFAVFLQRDDEYFRVMDLKTGVVIANVPVLLDGASLLGLGTPSDFTGVVGPSSESVVWHAGCPKSEGRSIEAAYAIPAVGCAQEDSNLAHLQFWHELGQCLQVEQDNVVVHCVTHCTDLQPHDAPPSRESSNPTAEALPVFKKQLRLSHFHLLDIICSAYELLHQVSKGRDPEQVFQMVVNTDHVDRISNVDALYTFLQGPRFTGTLGAGLQSTKGPTAPKSKVRRSASPHSRTKSPSSGANLRGVEFAHNLTQEVASFGATHLMSAAPMGTVKAQDTERNPSEKVKTIIKNRESMRYDRETRLASRWQAMAAGEGVR
jgi:WD40 repeat protein